jgi:dCTP deaminase
MLLSDKTILHYLNHNKIRFDPMPDLDVALGSCSIDLRLGQQLRRPYGDTIYDLTEYAPGWRRYYLAPGEFLLGATAERVRLPDSVAGRLEGRSSLARLGLMIHSTAGLIDPGWEGVITLELSNVGPEPVVLELGMRICALAFEFVDKPVAVPYHNKPNNKYAGASGPRKSKLHEEDR